METSIWWFDGPWIGTPGASSLGRHRTKPPCTLCRTNFAISPLGSPVVSGHSFGRLGVVVFHSVTWEFPTKKGTDCHLENNGCAIWMIFERGCTRRMKPSVHIRSHIFCKLFECSSSHQCRVFRSTIIYPNEILVIHLIRPGLLLMSSFLNIRLEIVPLDCFIFSGLLESNQLGIHNDTQQEAHTKT